MQVINVSDISITEEDNLVIIGMLENDQEFDKHFLIQIELNPSIEDIKTGVGGVHYEYCFPMYSQYNGVREFEFEEYSLVIYFKENSRLGKEFGEFHMQFNKSIEEKTITKIFSYVQNINLL